MKGRLGIAVLAGVFAALLPLAAWAMDMTPIKADSETAHYKLALQIGPMEKMYSAAEVAAKHLTDGEVMLGGMMTMPASMNMAATRHLEVHVYARDTGKVLTDANVTIVVTDTATKAVQTVPPAKMYGIKEGTPDTHFGNNVDMPPGHYRIDVTVNGEKAHFDVTVPAA